MELGFALGVAGAIVVFIITRYSDNKFQQQKLEAMRRRIARQEKPQNPIEQEGD